MHTSYSGCFSSHPLAQNMIMEIAILDDAQRLKMSVCAPRRASHLGYCTAARAACWARAEHCPGSGTGTWLVLVTGSIWARATWAVWKHSRVLISPSFSPRHFRDSITVNSSSLLTFPLMNWDHRDQPPWLGMFRYVYLAYKNYKGLKIW